VTEEEASSEPQEERSDKEMTETAAPTATAPAPVGLSIWGRAINTRCGNLTARRFHERQRSRLLLVDEGF